MKLRYKILNGLLAFVALGAVTLGLVLSHSSDCEPSPALADGTPSMKAVMARCYGSPDVLEFADVEKPEPAANEVLVRIHNAAVNPLDWHYMRGTPYLLRLMAGIGSPDDPKIGVDFSGTVVAVGSEVTKFSVGDEVFGGGNGAFAEYMIIREESNGLAHKPEGVPFDQAATVGIAGITALQAVRDHADIQPGDKVLINGASGGVGTLAVQIAKHLGADVTGVCSTRNVEMVLGLGADRVIDYKNDDYTQSGEQYDVIIDTVGNHSIPKNQRVIKPEGKLVLVGGKKGNWIAPLLGSINSKLISPFTDQQIGTMLAVFSRDDLEELGSLMESGAMTTFIGHRYSLAETAEAIRLSEKRHARGKIVLDVL